MWLGDVVADRFIIERPIGAGGMGSVFLAKDRVEGRSVAVKVLDLSTEDAVERFRREARLLSELSHPGIVRYIAHGETTARESFLVMELLRGEDLAQRLAGGGLSVDESLTVVQRAAGALGFAHRRGIVHRDVKPSNLFLVDGDPERVKVLDFGVARAALQTASLTRSGAMLGTVGYMAPEQATGSRDVDARADVFALGCVLFECLTGKPAFSGQHAIAVLAKVLSEEAPRISDHHAHLGNAIDELVAQMLAKNPAARPGDLSEVVSALNEARTAVPGSTRTWLSPGPVTLSHAEQRIVSVILAEPSAGAEHSDTTIPAQSTEDLTRVHQLAARTGVELMPLEGGALVLVVSGRGTATDQAMEAASCALALARLTPALRIALATGRAETTNRLPVGPAIDRAAALLRATDNGRQESIVIDEVTAGLLGARFEVRRIEERQVLVSERTQFEWPRLLMGKPTPTVGRDRELAMLEATLVECIDDSVARAVLVTALPGVGKSRLAAEFLRQVSARRQTRVLLARATSSGAGSPLALAAQLVSQALEVSADASTATERSRLRRYVRERVPVERADIVAEFLGEIAGIPGDCAPSPILRAAQNDAAVMQEQKRRAFEVLMDAEAARGPLLIVLEDLHWGDAPSVRYLDETLRRLTDSPLMILALARPEVHEQFPKLWHAAGLQEIRLGGFSRKAAERLVRAVLGESIEPALVTRIIERADGNAFYLEELIRHVAHGDMTLPETVLAMAQSRLERLEPEARRVLRAASVYGETCWSGAVAALLGSTLDAPGWLDTLSDRELLVRSRESQCAGEGEYVFRHALLRDAAYAMLTEEDRRNAHGRPGAWLESAGEKDGRVIADHFERAGEHERAVPWIEKATQAALGSGDLAGAIELAERGKRLGAAGEARGRLLAAEGMAMAYSSRPCTPIMREAIPLLPTGSSTWWSAVAAPLYEAGTTNSGPDQVAEFLQLALTTKAGEDLSGPYGMAINAVVTTLVFIGQAKMARVILEPFEGLDAHDPRCDPVFSAWLDASRSQFALSPLESAPLRLERALGFAERSALAMASGGAVIGESLALFLEACAASFCGLFPRAEAAAKRSIQLARRAGAEVTYRYASIWLAFVLTRSGRAEDAVRCLESLTDQLDPAQAQWRHTFLADAYRRQGALTNALTEARAATAGLLPTTTAFTLPILARLHLDLGQPEECLRVAELPRSTVQPAYAADLFTSKALALRALGRDKEAAQSLATAREIVLDAARDFENPDLRSAFLTNVDENPRTLALAREWLGEAE